MLARDLIAQEYETRRKNDGKAYEITTRPYWSTGSIVAQVVAPQGAPATAAFLQFMPQAYSLFTYQQNGTRDDGFNSGTNLRTTYADTNLTSARQTIEQEDFVGESFRLSVVGVRCYFDAATIGRVLNQTPEVTAALQGLTVIHDPASLLIAPQIGSPANLRDVLSDALRPNLSLTQKWQGKNLDAIGLGTHTPDLAARSLLMSAGEPLVGNAYSLKEGFVWRKTGSSRDTEMEVQMELENVVHCIISAVNLFGVAPAVLPTRIAVDFRLQLDGVAFSYPSAN